MANKKGSGLLMVWADVPSEKEAEYSRWYNEEHLGDVLAMPGVLNAARYEAVKGGPKHLACYELENAQVTASDEFRRLRENPSEWSKRSGGLIIATNYISNLYELIHPDKVTSEVAQAEMAPVLQIGRMDISPAMEDRFNEWYNTIFVPNFEKVPGCIRARRYCVSRYRVVGGVPKYATVYEFEHEKVSESAEWAAQREASPVSAQIRPHMRLDSGSPGVWKKTFQLPA